MKKINLKGISEILSEKELKNVLGGSDCYANCGVSVTNCNGTCSADGNCAKCVGQTETLTKCCNP